MQRYGKRSLGVGLIELVVTTIKRLVSTTTRNPASPLTNKSNQRQKRQQEAVTPHWLALP